MAMITLSGHLPYIYILLKVLHPARCCTAMTSVAVDLAVPLVLTSVLNNINGHYFFCMLHHSFSNLLVWHYIHYIFHFILFVYLLI